MLALSLAARGFGHRCGADRGNKRTVWSVEAHPGVGVERGVCEVKENDAEGIHEQDESRMISQDRYGI